MNKSSTWGAVSVLIALTIGMVVGGYIVRSHFKAILSDFIDSPIIEYRTDTLRVPEPILIASEPVHDSILVYLHDTAIIVRSDTIYLPMEQRCYSDSTYTAWVSGYRPKLDSIYVFPKTKIIRNPTPVKRWDFGIQAGLGAVKPFGGSASLGYYFGFGICYNF